jgi:hypothetical protein
VHGSSRRNESERLQPCISKAVLAEALMRRPANRGADVARYLWREDRYAQRHRLDHRERDSPIDHL